MDSRLPTMPPFLSQSVDDDPPQVTLTVEGLFVAHARYVAAFGARLLGRSDELDDLVQDVFLQAQRGLAAVRDPAAVKGWLATIAVRNARQRLRRRRLRAWIGLDDDGIDEAPSAATSPESHAILVQLYARLDRVAVNDRLAWSLRMLEGEPLERVALLCECSLATAKRRISAVTAFLTEGER